MEINELCVPGFSWVLGAVDTTGYNARYANGPFVSGSPQVLSWVEPGTAIAMFCQRRDLASNTMIP